MGRLFWKVFLGFWITILCIAAIAAMAVFTAQKTNSDDDDFTDATTGSAVALGRRATNLVERQAVVLRFGGEQALREMLDSYKSTTRRRNRPNWIRYTPHSVRVVNQDNVDLFGRTTPSASIDAARQRVNRGADGARVVNSREGNDFLMFVPNGSNGVPRRRARPWYERISPAMIVAAGIVFSALFSGLLAWYLARPIRALRDGFDDVSAGNLDTRVANKIGSRRDELADLGQYFDRTILRLQQLIQSQKRLLHDVSHELRSPLARIQAAIGLMQQSPDKSVQMIDRIEKESTRLDGLIGEILTLSRLDEDAGHGEVHQIELDDLIADIATDARFEAVDRHIRIEVNGTSGSIRGYTTLLHRAIENLIRNAVKYTGDESVVTVDVSRGDDAVFVTVSDCGPGIAPEDMDSVVEPFVRVGTERTDPGGFGLGLTIANRAVGIHGGELSLSNRTGDQTGLVAQLRLPIDLSTRSLRPAQ